MLIVIVTTGCNADSAVIDLVMRERLVEPEPVIQRGPGENFGKPTGE